MTNDEIEFDLNPPSSQAGSDTVGHLDTDYESFVYNWEDYLLLPDCGEHHYNLPDAALLAAIDAFLSNQIPEFPADGHWGSYDVDDPEVRSGIAITQKRILDLLIRCVHSGLLKAEVKARNASDSVAVPDRTYVLIGDLMDCLEVHGFQPGDYFAQELEDQSSSMQEKADAIARQKAHFRYGTAALPPMPSEPTEQPETYWKNVAHSQSLAIAALRSQMGGKLPAPPERELSTKERNTLLSIIAVLCQETGLDLNRTAKTAGILHAAAARMGIMMGETTIETKLKAIPDAIASRMR